MFVFMVLCEINYLPHQVMDMLIGLLALNEAQSLFAGPQCGGGELKVSAGHVGGCTARRCVSGLRVLRCFGLCGNSLDSC